MEANARFEIWFLSDDRISVLVETDQETGAFNLLEMFETIVFAALAAGVIANLPNDVREPLCRWLADFAAPVKHDEIPTRVGDLVLVLPDAERGRKGFEGTVKLKEGGPVARWKPRGFRLFGREVQDYSQTAIQALLLYLTGGQSAAGRAILAATARALGRFGLVGAVGMRNHPAVAMTALDVGMDEATETFETSSPSEGD